MFYPVQGYILFALLTGNETIHILIGPPYIVGNCDDWVSTKQTTQATIHKQPDDEVRSDCD